MSIRRQCRHIRCGRKAGGWCKRGTWIHYHLTFCGVRASWLLAQCSTAHTSLSGCSFMHTLGARVVCFTPSCSPLVAGVQWKVTNVTTCSWSAVAGDKCFCTRTTNRLPSRTHRCFTGPYSTSNVWSLLPPCIYACLGRIVSTLADLHAIKVQSARPGDAPSGTNKQLRLHADLKAITCSPKRWCTYLQEQSTEQKMVAGAEQGRIVAAP